MKYYNIKIELVFLNPDLQNPHLQGVKSTNSVSAGPIASVCVSFNICLSCFRFVGPLGSITIKCKDLRVIQLDIPGMEECLNIASSIEVDSHFPHFPH